MIDYRIVYNWYNGGTFWDTLPVAITDVERIEVVRGPSSALYGPNAATGVIHIITNKKGNRANISTGTRKNISKAQMDISRVSAHTGGDINDQFSYSVSVGNQETTRTNDSYHSNFDDMKVGRDDLKNNRGAPQGERGQSHFQILTKLLALDSTTVRLCTTTEKTLMLG